MALRPLLKYKASVYVMKYKQLVSKYMYISLYVIDGEVEKGGPTMFDFIDFVLTRYYILV